MNNLAVKPRIFIGSSSEGIDLANAIQSNLQRIAHPRVWSQGTFGLNEATTASLMREVRDADFGIFVFTADDVSEIRGKLLNVARDNVVFELGLFSGELGTDRCCFLVPMGVDMHLPSDLLGLTAGEYDPSRLAGEWQAATGPFCTDITRRIREKNRRRLSDHELAIAFAGKYDGCEYITNVTERVRAKDAVFREMLADLRDKRISKWRLIAEQTIGFYAAFAATVIGKPEIADPDLILSIIPATVTPGNIQHRLLDAIESLDKAGLLPEIKKRSVFLWLASLRQSDTEFVRRMNILSA